jgi:hypothetical protein
MRTRTIATDVIEDLEALIKERAQISPPDEEAPSQGRTPYTNNIFSTSASILVQWTKAKGRGRTVGSAGVPHQLQVQFCHGNWPKRDKGSFFHSQG